MPWSPPAIPITGTTITVAFATSLITNGLNWLRQLTGNGDPPGVDYVAVSTSTSTATWQKIGSSVINAGGVSDANMANQKVNAATPLPMATTFLSLLGANKNGFFEVQSPSTDAPTPGQAYYVYQQVEGNIPAQYACQLAVDIANHANVYLRIVRAGSPDVWSRMWHQHNDGAGSGLDADTLDGVELSNIVPSGLIAAVRTAAAIPTGWTRFTDGDGRILIGAGTTFSVTFTENTAVGASWSHQHAATGLTATSGGIAVTADAPFLVNVGTNTNVTTSTHTHPAPTVTMGGNTANTAWQEPARIVVWAIKT